jgi:hypothetical protein
MLKLRIASYKICDVVVKCFSAVFVKPRALTAQTPFFFGKRKRILKKTTKGYLIAVSNDP